MSSKVGVGYSTTKGSKKNVDAVFVLYSSTGVYLHNSMLMLFGIICDRVFTEEIVTSAFIIFLVLKMFITLKVMAKNRIDRSMYSNR